ncbi:ferric-dicitrate binding protein FerR (iron transport regulator) [Chitinophaga dinghuensis]|uniref:Ferric-dicitrate binding protein FerR (Iron transport regulator) n=1 Tax=Chitinophaga dinghuensis TaxID=1539050 RepID=A0A327VNQ3_9BACT|nr:FecR family protein [Chitinophaga dinghuensis]RAJ75037.1 ferric-dicitrate binding protein FerR (iron transport regulator) [Chitinophaga dinghuensis]
MIPSFSDEALYTLLCKYLLDEADEEERAWVNSWLTDHEDNVQLLEALRKVLDTAAAQQYAIPANTDSSWNQLYSRMTTEEQPDAEPILTPVRNFSWSTFLKVAAVLLVLVGVGGWFLATRPAARYNGPVAATLEDGSKIELKGDASSLSVAKGFNDKNRKVVLKGSAVFDIAANATQPFIVSLGHTEVKVLGTRFTVNYEPNKSVLQVHVSSGKVMVIDHSRSDSVILTEGMLLQQDAQKPDFRIAAHVLDPENKSLAFRNVPLEEVLQSVTAVYDVKVVVDNTSLLKLSIDSDLTGAPIDSVMETLARSINVQWEKTGDRQYRLFERR